MIKSNDIELNRHLAPHTGCLMQIGPKNVGHARLVSLFVRACSAEAIGFQCVHDVELDGQTTRVSLAENANSIQEAGRESRWFYISRRLRAYGYEIARVL